VVGTSASKRAAFCWLDRRTLGIGPRAFKRVSSGTRGRAVSKSRGHLVSRQNVKRHLIPADPECLVRALTEVCDGGEAGTKRRGHDAVRRPSNFPTLRDDRRTSDPSSFTFDRSFCLVSSSDSRMVCPLDHDARDSHLARHRNISYPEGYAHA